MSDAEPDSQTVDQFIVYGAYGEIMHQFQLLELTLWGFLARNLKSGITFDQGVAKVERWDATTFGKLWRGLRTQDHWPAGLVAELDQAIEARNFLAHHFLREYFLVVPSEEHREDALTQLARTGGRLDAVMARLDEHARALGLPDDDELDEQTHQAIEALRPTGWFTASSEASDDQSPNPAARPEAEPDAETGGHDARSGASKYNLGQPHSSSAQSAEERVLDRMSEEQIQRFMQNFHDVIVPQLLHTADTVRGTAAGLQSITTALAEFYSTAALIRDAWSHQILNVIAPALLDLPPKLMRATGPPHWKDLTDEELRAVRITATAGMPVTWIPRTSILRELLTADAADQLTVLDTHAAAIVDDCEAAVSQTRSGTFATLATYTEEAILTYQAGHTAAAQALAASLIDTLLRTTFYKPTSKNFQYGKVRAAITEQPSLLPQVIACLPVANALETFHGHMQVPATFNRHASAHAVGTEQYTPANALVSLMLATSLLRQAHHAAHEAPEDDDLA
ncbi:hypothetical protein [Amycolatopsis sp. cmx-4-54]|uniref:hypothetical protein n=1 Tax=Amycolatopsis sp. cmx-4-54 TaxID=2790936 RepID=UPI00397B18CA